MGAAWQQAALLFAEPFILQMMQGEK